MNYGAGSFLELLDKQIVDFMIRSRGDTLKTDHVAIAAIDTKAIDHFGQWPWGRDVMARFLYELQTHYQVSVLGYDVLFSEPDTNDITAEYVLDRFHQLVAKQNQGSSSFLGKLRNVRSKVSSEVKNDAKFGAELSKWNNIVLGYFFFLSGSSDQIKHLTQEELDEFASRIENSEITIIQGAEFLPYLPLYEGEAVEANIPLLNSRNNLNGFFNVVPDREDGTIRRVPLVIKYKDMFYPSLDLQIIRRYYGNPPIRMVVNEGGIEAVFLGRKMINTASDGTVMINYRGEAFTFPHYSVYDIIEHKIPVEKLKDKIVLLGATEIGVFDLRTTPVGTAFPGVEVHANLIDNLINEDYFHRSDFVHFLSFILILVCGLIVGIVLPRLSALPGLIFSIVLLVGYFGINLWYLNTERTWTSFVYVIGVILFNWFIIVLYKFFGEEKDKRFIKGAFQQYLSPKVIDRLVDDPSMLKLGGEKRELTAFFSDVQGFSTISESLTPEELVELLNEYLTAMTDIVMKYDGTVDKFEGDAVIAFFGAPVIYADHATRACLASLEMQEKLVEMRENWKKQGRHELYVRIGLNTGDMVVGNMGSAYRMDYTMMGDSVNLAARLEGVNKEYRTFCMISEFTYKKTRSDIEVRELDMIRVVGKNEPVRVYEVLGRKGDVPPEELKAYRFFEKGLAFYRQQKWDEARKYFAHTNKLLKSDGASQIFFDRCQMFKTKPPGKKWDGVFQMATK
ncbi:MAG: adenylate/guanylate cyclase domain-containing protein [Proteobacteria bacterium]|nr:adenylate/guanylate cyclase domain-containing protein [Pseudomonadota bacterium]